MLRKRKTHLDLLLKSACRDAIEGVALATHVASGHLRADRLDVSGEALRHPSLVQHTAR